MINRFSSRRQNIYKDFLGERLVDAARYDRVAGYFSSSILEIAGERLEQVTGKIRMVCNSDIVPRDAEIAKAAEQALRKEWCASEPEKLTDGSSDRFTKLFHLLKSGKLEVRVLPTEKFGLVHGKAGVIENKSGKKTSFIGSTNETLAAWKLNYEIVWEDDSDDAIKWVQEEFDMFWNHPLAIPLSKFVVEDIERLSKREVVGSIEDWRKDPEPAAPIVESPVYRKETGLGAHQKFFIKTAFDLHKGPYGARLVLADSVGLGKTVQLGMSAQLMALYGGGPVLVVAPKTLLWQWQGELKTLLDVPCAVWDSNHWVDENGIDYPSAGPESIRDCPRRIGIISQGLITSGSPIIEYIKTMKLECLIVDEAHRCRRRNLGDNREGEKPDPNNLMKFLMAMAPNAKSVLLGTATPVQMYPIEVWDLIAILGMGTEFVLGNDWSNWRKPAEALSLIMGRTPAPTNDLDLWGWIRNPLPPANEDIVFTNLRRALKMKDNEAIAPGDYWERLPDPRKAQIRNLEDNFLRDHNPIIRHVIRRTRDYLEQQLDPDTNEPMLKPVKVELLGEQDPIQLPAYLAAAYHTAEEFCSKLAKRAKGAGFLKTLLLRRVGSSIEAGRITATKMLKEWPGISQLEGEDDETQVQDTPDLKDLTIEEKRLLKQFIEELEANRDNDPKLAVVLKCLGERGWLKQGCIIFSQYFDSIWWLAEKLRAEYPQELIGIYAGGAKSGLIKDGSFKKMSREELKTMVAKGELRLLLGTDAASEGLNLQKLGTLINLDLPWNPTRLEQRKGRIQRIGQVRDLVSIYNMRYADSVEDRVHDLLSGRLENIFDLFGQIPDVLEDAWIAIAEGEIEEAKRIIGDLPTKHPFELRYRKPESVPWETCGKVLDNSERLTVLKKPWRS